MPHCYQGSYNQDDHLSGGYFSFKGFTAENKNKNDYREKYPEPDIRVLPEYRHRLPFGYCGPVKRKRLEQAIPEFQAVRADGSGEDSAHQRYKHDLRSATEY